MTRGAIFLTLIVLFFAGCSKDDVRVGEYKPSAAFTELRAAMDTCTMTSSAVRLARTFMEKYPDDVSVQVLASSIRYDMTGAEQEAYYRKHAERQPENAIAQFLAGRITYSPEEGQRYAKIILDNQPDSYWGHLLLGRSLTWKDSLTDEEFERAAGELKRAISIDNSLPYAVESLGVLYMQRGDTTRADKLYAKLASLEPAEFSHVMQRAELWPYNIDRVLNLIDDFLREQPKNLRALAQKADLLYQRQEWKEYRETILRALAVEPDSVLAYNVACSFAVEDQPDSALAWLTRAVELGYGDVENASDDPDLVSVRQDPRWDELKARMAEQRRLQIADISKRELAEAHMQRADWAAFGLPETAPDFTLTGLDGVPVKLSELRGKLVVLDFWATWCYWCHKASPLVEEFYAKSDSNLVAVFGVNVMEREVNAEALQAFQLQRGVHFPTLAGTQELTEQYKVIGLPSIFVIDPKGKFAYRAFGYSPALEETLTAIAAEYFTTGEPRPLVQQAPES